MSLALLLILIFHCDKCAPEPAVSRQLKDVWLAEMPEISPKQLEGLRDEAWEMFDFGWRNYIRLAFPRDNLLPLSCKGQDWQGGISITLLDALDTFLLMNRKEDMEDALKKIEQHVHFDLDTKVHVFEVVIRVLGGLLSGHLLLERSPEAFPTYNGILLDKAIDIAQRLRPAFDSPTGLPYLFVNLRKGKLATLDKNSNTTCTACAGTLLLEFGHLSVLTGDPQWAELAEHAAEAMFNRRSSLGLVGGSINVDSSAWVSREATTGPGVDSYYEYLLKVLSREATTGPGVDSYYEYLLKSYLTFGNWEHLQMFIELYGSVMQQLQPPPYLPGNAFLVSAHMDSGRLSRTFVSSLAAFWPAMQALVGLEKEAVQLHEGFLSAWREFGWLPELFGLELEQIDPHDPGYQLRPESIESNYILHALTQDPKYLDVARRIQRILNTHNRVECGFASINNVTTGDHSDIQESYFLSETVKYLYLTFVEGSEALLDYFIFSTEGHLLPPQPPVGQEAAAAEKKAYMEAISESQLEPKCARFCEPPDPVTQAAALSKLQQAFPLLQFDAADAVLIQRRRCVACTQVTKHMGSRPAADSSLKIEQLSLAVQTGLDKSQVLSQILCLVDVHPRTDQLYCSGLRSITVYDIEHGLPANAILLQLSWVVQPTLHAAVLFVSPRGGPGAGPHHHHLGNALMLPGAAAEFGPSLVDMTPACAQHLLEAAAAWAASPTAPSDSSEVAEVPSVLGGRPGAGEEGDAAEGAHGALDIESGRAGHLGLSEGSEAAKEVVMGRESDAKEEGAGEEGQEGHAAGGACGVLQGESGPTDEVLGPSEAREGVATTGRAQPSGPVCERRQSPGPAKDTRTGKLGLVGHSHQSQSDKPQPSGPLCAPLSPLLGGLLPQVGQQLVAAVQAVMLGGSCSATGADSSEVGGPGESVGVGGGSEGSAGAGGEKAGGGVGGREAGVGERTEEGADSDQQINEGVQEEDLCMDGQILEQQQQQQQQEAKQFLPQAGAIDGEQQCAAQLEGDLSVGGHEREGDSRRQGGDAGGIAEQQQQQQTAGPPCKDTHKYCQDWARRGECSSNPRWMLKFCPAACQQCTLPSQEVPASGAAQTPTATAGAGSVAAGSTASAATTGADAAGAAQHGHEGQGAHHEHEDAGAQQEQVKREQAEEHEAGPLDEDPCMADPHSWGPCERVPLTHGPAILADPPDACVPFLHNAHHLGRAVVVVIRRGCAFAAKAQAAEAAGAVAFVVLNLAEEEVVVMGGMADAQDGKGVSIPGMLLGRTAAILLLREMHTAAVHKVPWPEVTLALDPHTQGARDRSDQEEQLTDQQLGAEGRGRSRPGSQQLGMLVPTSSVRFIQKLITIRDQNLQSMLMDIAADDEAILLLLQVARESGPNSPSQIQKRQTKKQDDRAKQDNAGKG